jgi:H-NS histone family protein
VDRGDKKGDEGKNSQSENESRVWVGTGRKPKWLTDLIKSGRTLEEFLITQTSGKEFPQPEGGEAKPVTGEIKDETKEVKTELRF